MGSITTQTRMLPKGPKDGAKSGKQLGDEPIFILVHSPLSLGQILRPRETSLIWCGSIHVKHKGKTTFYFQQ